MPPEKPTLSEIAYAVELLQCWSLFEKSGGEIRQSLSLVSKRFGKQSLETKNNRKYMIFSKNFKDLLFYKEKTYAASYSRGLFLFYTLILWKIRK